MIHTPDYPWFQYLETPRHRGRPVKLNQILEARLQLFLRAKRAALTHDVEDDDTFAARRSREG
ncbi:MAG TPA: hypothetical protein VF597_02995 [Candidatus Saccharimonadales bacterium]|jgi:hypothetical protein